MKKNFICAILSFSILFLSFRDFFTRVWPKGSVLDAETMSSKVSIKCDASDLYHDRSRCKELFEFSVDEKEYTCSNYYTTYTNFLNFQKRNPENQKIYYESANPSNCRSRTRYYTVKEYVLIMIILPILLAIFCFNFKDFIVRLILSKNSRSSERMHRRPED